MENVLDVPFEGASLDWVAAQNAAAQLEHAAKQVAADQARALRRIASALEAGMRRALGSPTSLRARLSAEERASLLLVHEDSADALPGIVAHERFHALQRDLATRLERHIDEKAFMDDPGAARAGRSLMSLGYPTDLHTLSSEIAAHIAGGPEQWAKLDLSRDEARRLMRRYIQLLREQHGDKTRNAIERFAPQLQEVLDNAEKFERIQRAAAGTRGGRAPGEVRRGVRPDLARRGEEAELDLDFDAEAQAEAERQQRERITAEQLTAEFATPLTSENRRKKLRKSTASTGQQGLFETEVDPQGSLFVRRRLSPAEIEQKRKKSEERRIAMRARAIDLSEKRLGQLVQEVSGRQIRGRAVMFGTSDITKLNPLQRAEVLRRLMATDAEARPLQMPGRPLLAGLLHSPSYVLGQSGHGSRIYAAAEHWFFEQKRLTRRFDRNYHKLTDGLSADEKQQIANFRLGIDETGQRVPPAPLPAKLAAVNDELTRFVFEPMWQRGVKEGLVGADRHIDDYLTYYQDNKLRLKSANMAEVAANLAMELGVPVELAERILEQANPKAKKFGPFDYRRAAESIPGLRDLDRISELYIKGFARKVAQANFEKVFRRERPKIKDPGLRAYAKDYGAQYLGQLRQTPADEWLARKIAATPILRRFDLSVGRIVGAATSVQFMAKIGANPFTALQNVTQALTNTLPEIGHIRAARVLPAAASASRLGRLVLPKSVNPWWKEVVRLNRSGILDSQLMKFDRPTHTGRLGSALSFMFDTAEEFNRSLSYLGTFDNARAAGKTRQEAALAAREAVRVQHFFSGRLDAALWTRTPPGRLTMQFKTFQAKQMEFVFKRMRFQPRRVKAKFALGLIALGGPAAVGLLQVARTILDEDDELLEMLEGWQDTMNVAAFLHADNLARQIGVFWVPGLEDVNRWDAKARLLGWAAGPTISSIIDSAQAGSQSLSDRDKASQFVATLFRGFAPGGAELRRIRRAMDDADGPRDALRILTAWNYRQTKGPIDPEIRRLLGADDLLKEIERDQRRLLGK
jgi:hypothetical protein